jgi:hypothetical protein
MLCRVIPAGLVQEYMGKGNKKLLEYMAELRYNREIEKQKEEEIERLTQKLYGGGT